MSTQDADGRRQVQRVIGNLLAACVFSADDVWCVAPRFVDFDVLDNRAGDWSAVNPSWGPRKIRLTELLATLADAVGRVRVVSTRDPQNDGFVSAIQSAQTGNGLIDWCRADQPSPSGVLTASFFLSAPMDLAPSEGQNVRLTTARDEIQQVRRAIAQRCGE
jgi:hypothetical protein